MAALAAVVTGPALAEQFYFGLGAGSAHLDTRPVAITSTFPAQNGTVTSYSYSPVGGNDTAYTARFGVRLHRNWAAELGYSDLGKYSFDTVGSNGLIQGETKVSSYHLSLVGIMPLDQVDLYARAGYARSELKSSASDSGLSADGKDKVNGFVGGVGARWNFMPNVGAFAEYQGYSKLKVNGFLVGVDLRF
jgi:hypothetical protein